MGNPHIVSRGAQTNFSAFAEWIDEAWNTNEAQFNERYFQSTAALLLMFQFLEQQIPKLTWYEGGYRANIIYYTTALFRKLIRQQFSSSDLDLILIWNKQELPEIVQRVLLDIAEKVFFKITDPQRKVINVTQWCKRTECWDGVKALTYELPTEIQSCLISAGEAKSAERSAKKDQKITNDINAQVEVIKYSAEIWKRVSEFAVMNHLVSPADVSALAIACKMPEKLPNSYQSKRLLALLSKVREEGFNLEQ